jgi:predicted DNA-binding mobile mystery protein A
MYAKYIDLRIYMRHMACKGFQVMSPSQAILARKNLDRRLATLQREAVAVPPRGWLKGIREALGLSTRQLATRMGAAYSRISAMEKAEAMGAITIRTMREAAEAMDCTFVYAIVPTTSLDDIVRRQATQKAEATLDRLHHTMRLENQAMEGEDLAHERQRIMAELLAGPSRRLWDDK